MGLETAMAARLLDRSESDAVNARRIRNMIFIPYAEQEPLEPRHKNIEEDKSRIA